MGIGNQMVLIRNNDLFSQMADEVFDSLNLVHHFKETKKNDYIYFEAHLHNALYFLKEGYVKIGYFDKSGREVIKEVIGKGDIFGQITLQPHNMEGEFAQAFKTDVSLCMFRVQEFAALLEQHPSIAIRFSKQLGQKMLRVENRMVNLLQKSVPERLLHFLYHLTRQFPEYAQSNTFIMPNIFTHDDLARLLGSSRQTITSLLNEWERAGWLSVGQGLLKIEDVKRLQNKIDVG